MWQTSLLLYYHLGMLARIVTTGALYKKTLELNLKTIGELSIGKIVNLASNDVQRLDIVSQCLCAQNVQMCLHITRFVYKCNSSTLGFLSLIPLRPSHLCLIHTLHHFTLWL